jgi:uncharacterized protein (AIM24 family)
MRSSLFGEHLESAATETFSLQNPKMLRVALDGDVMARQGAMVAYQGSVQFEYQGSGGVGRFLKKALTGEGLPLMRATGRGELFLAHDADEVHLIHLDGEGLTVNGANVLAFDATLEWDIRRVEGASMFAGGLFNTVLTGTGWVAITAHGTPVVLDAGSQPTFADAQSAVAWSAGLQTALQRSFKAGALIGRGSGEAYQIGFTGQGFVVVQASEGPTVPPHSHGQ